MIKKYFRLFVAKFRLNQQVVCEESASQGYYDYHDYPDSIEGLPVHFMLLKCKYCQKEFYC